MTVNISREKIEEGRLRAQKERQDKIAQAIERGVPICRLSAPLFNEERETNISVE
jgi:predicted peroxiredoxin